MNLLLQSLDALLESPLLSLGEATTALLPLELGQVAQPIAQRLGFLSRDAAALDTTLDLLLQH